MNAHGVLVGDDVARGGLVWENGSLRDLGKPPGAEWRWTSATAMNESGDVVGYAQRGNVSRAFLVTSDGTYALGATGGRPPGLEYVWAVNDHGQVLGRAGDEVALWANGQLREISHPDRIWAVLNDRGWVAFGGASASLWIDGRVRDLGSFGGGSVEVVDLTDDGMLVGTVYGKYPWSQAFAWRDGVMTKLPSRGRRAEAVAANERGQIIGNIGPRTDPHAVMWTSVGG